MTLFHRLGALVAALGLAEVARWVSSADSATARRAALAMKLGLLDEPIVPEVLDPLLDAWRTLVATTGALTVVRSSALVEAGTCKASAESSSVWHCPHCGATMIVVQRLTAAELSPCTYFDSS